ncbi:hypothetical protein C3Y98_11315 [Methylotenera oryzisoli]|uniref:DGQHR domain-containing protein n=1 Tax=Methylotenera oryzisoli TaxID=2080758 RepID=A0A4Y9VN16_9PROT|nr:DGQHR domain-containing protein [Methylotenera oryzisoli]TFW70050.1 hypothetical protein C3Y98_11315 [Methylotenera oryzisoli]
MAFIESAEIEQLKTKFTEDPSTLGKLYKSKKSDYYIRNVDHNLADAMIKDGWEEIGQLKTKTKLRIRKSHSTKFEDDIWCQLYDLGYRCLNTGNDFRLNFGKDVLEKKQIDVFAVNDDSILLIECKSSQTLSKASSFKTEFESLEVKLQGFSKTLEQLFGRSRKVKYIFATRNLRIEEDGVDIQRLKSTGSFFYNDNTFEYVNSLIKAYKKAAHYQFMSLLFKGKSINKDRIEVPAIEGFMGNKKYYMFSIEPHLLLKIGFILHRTRANQAEMPTYQRLLVPQRLQGISKFIDDGGYFPNSIILNFSNNEQLQFEASQRGEDSRSRLGILKIPNAYAIAYIIDGQHRVYGYAQSDFKESNTIPVVAFYGLESNEQLKIFMDINENQKAVSPTLRITLEKDLYWNSDRADSRIKALRSSIIDELSTSMSGPLYNKISLGEDKAKLSASPFGDALMGSGLLPKAKGNNYEINGSEASLYNINNHDNNSAMQHAQDSIVKFLSKCYEFVEEKYPDIFTRDRYFIMSNRGTFAFIRLIGSLNVFESNNKSVNVLTKPEERFRCISKYVEALLSQIQNLPKEEEERLLGKLGAGADTYWFRYFQSLVHQKYPHFLPDGLADWIERQDMALLEDGRRYGTEVEKYIKKNVIHNLKILFKDDWDLEIGSIKNECVNRANADIEKRYKEGFGRRDIPWTDMFHILDYKTIIEKFWTKLPEESSDSFRNFEDIFSIDVGHGFNSKSDKTKWLSLLNTYRNSYAHDGSKEKGLTKEEVKTLEKIHEQLLGNKIM